MRVGPLAFAIIANMAIATAAEAAQDGRRPSRRWAC